jgi:transposase
MAPRISQEMRERMVVWSEEGRPCGEIANLTGCSLRSVYKILEYHREYGTTQNPFAESIHGRCRHLDMGDINYITSLIEARPKIFLDELNRNRGRDVSISSASVAEVQFSPVLLYLWLNRELN